MMGIGIGAERYLWNYLFTGTRGGFSRVRIVKALERDPLNANQIKTMLKMEYKNVRHHLKMLEKNNVIGVVEKDSYGAMYYLSDYFKSNKKLFDEIWEKVKKG